jgi:hypothetical protein
MTRHHGSRAGAGTGVVYAALGDSMSIDDYAGGPGRGATSLLLRNRDDDFPVWAGRDLTARDPGRAPVRAGHQTKELVPYRSVGRWIPRVLGLSRRPWSSVWSCHQGGPAAKGFGRAPRACFSDRFGS